MKQCMLTRGNVTARGLPMARSQQIAWLPDEFAVEGKAVDVLWRREWDEGWTVSKVYDQHLTYDEVRQSVVNQRNYGASIN
jgi:hypothetical protein